MCWQKFFGKNWTSIGINPYKYLNCAIIKFFINYSFFPAFHLLDGCGLDGTDDGIVERVPVDMVAQQGDGHVHWGDNFEGGMPRINLQNLNLKWILAKASKEERVNLVGLRMSCWKLWNAKKWKLNQ